MKTKFIISFCIFAFLAAFSSCKDECPTYYAHPEALAYGAFKEGSWWIYQDDSTGERDCVYVKKLNTYFEEKTIDKKCKYKNQVLASSIYSNTISKFYYLIYAHENSSYVGFSYRNKKEYNFGFFTYKNLKFESSKYHEIYKYSDSYKFMGNTFNNLFFVNSSWGLDSTLKIQLWIAKEVGIVRIISKDSVIPNLSLVKFNVISYE